MPIISEPQFSKLISLAQLFIFNNKIPDQNSISTIPIRVGCLTMVKSRLGKRWWGECRRDWALVQHSSFVVALAAGNLTLDTFCNFVSQELYILRCSIRALELAMQGANDGDAKASFSLLIEDFMVHESLFKKWGFDCTKKYPANPLTVKYTDYLLTYATAKLEENPDKKKVAVCTLAIIMPHMQLYAFIGKKLQSILDRNRTTSHPYKDWINYHSSQYFKVSTLNAEDLPSLVAEDLLDKLSGGKNVYGIQKLYHEAIRFELIFFSSQPMGCKTVFPLLKEHSPSDYCFIIFSDFNMTCTVEDTSEILSGIFIGSGQNQTDWMTEADLKNTWGLLNQMYREECQKWMEKTLMTEYDRKVSHTNQGTTDETKKHGSEKFNCRHLRNALEELSEIRKRHNTRIIESGLLKCLNHEMIKRECGRISLQDGCMSFFQSITKNASISASIHVLSSCWCNDFIKAAFSSGELRSLDIHVNELMYEESIISTGERITISTGKMVRKVESPIDKFELCRNIIEKNDSGRKDLMLFGKVINHKKNKLIVYIGDSVDDLLCLVEADIGIVIGSDQELRKVGSCFNVKFVPLFEGLVENQKKVEEGSSSIWRGGHSGNLYTVSSWAEIHSFVVGF